MTHLDLLIPFALPPAEMAADLLRELKLPSLALLLSRTRSLSRTELDPYSPALPHEAWLAHRLGLTDKIDSAAASATPPFACPMMNAYGVGRQEGHWFILQPAHFHVARDHIVLSDPRGLVLDDGESRVLFDSARPLFEETGKELVYGDARIWFMRADDWADLQTSTPQAVSGHNIDIWMPKGVSARPWRRLLNEVQMLWHAHPVNEDRESKGIHPVNSLWLWGGAQVPGPELKSPYRKIFNAPAWAQGQGKASALSLGQGVDASAVLGDAPGAALAVLPDLMQPALAQDWAAWLDGMRMLEKNWFSIMLEGLRSGRIDQSTLILSHGTGLLEATNGANSLRKFWIKPALKNLSR